MKKYVYFVVITTLIFSVSCSLLACGIAPTKGIRKYKDDYIKKYEKTLNAMFDNEWKLISAEDKYQEHEPICEHVDTRPQQFIEWTIEYHDGNGGLRTFIFDNRSTLGSQIKDYIVKYVSEYYKENFYDVYTNDFPLAGSSYVFCFFVKLSSFTSYDEVKDIDNITKKYQSLLYSPEGTICLAKMTPASAFEICPIYLVIKVGLDGDQSYGQDFEEKVLKQTEDMVEAMNGFANNRLNAQIQVGYHQIVNMHSGNRDLRWAYLKGERVGFFDDRTIFESYKGIFW